ncbi:MAG: 3,4-dihydroxy 2-butanone 4-phosphate synthase / cyclohydrolase [Gaiellales bacterium]|nr:3,4-dihydroxy 2-butanone 4-phosphate synthase / cyclohydrolase [Gaiellales bacterium]
MSASMEEAIDAIRRGGMVVVVDDEDRENEGDLIVAAERATPETLAFMVRHGSGIVCVAMERERLEQLDLPLMSDDGSEAMGTAFTLTVDARYGTTTGVSAADRARTITVLIDPHTTPDDLRRPGHVFPLRSKRGGVLERAGHTEAAVDLARLAGYQPAGVLCELVNQDGTMSRLPDLELFAAEHDLPLLSIADLIAYRSARETLVRRVASARIPTDHGEFESIAYEDHRGRTHVALVHGDIASAPETLVRVHSECFTGDVLGSRRCDCGEQLDRALAQIAAEGAGVVVYIRGHEGRGIGLRHKLEAYELQDRGLDTVDANLALGFEADARDYGVGAQILASLGVTRMRLLTNNPAKRAGLEGHGLVTVERVPLITTPRPENASYLSTKRDRMAHELDTSPGV